MSQDVDKQKPTERSRRYSGVVFDDLAQSILGELTSLGRWIKRKTDPILNYRYFQLIVLSLFMAVWFGVFYHLGTKLHDNFGTVDFDLGIFDQAMWLVSFFKEPFMTVRGLDIWGHHASFIFYLLAPGYWLGGGVHYLIGVHVLAQVVAALGIFLLAKHLMPKERWIPLMLGSVVLLNPSWQWLIHEFFHPESFAMALLIFTYWAARTKQWKLYWLFFAATIICKEDMAIPLFFIGLLLILWKERKMGFITVGISVGWWLFVSKVLIPWRIGQDAFYNEYFSDLGSNPFSIFWNLVVHPMETWKLLTTKERLEYYWQMCAPFGFVFFLAPEVLMIGLPMLFINILGAYPWIYSYQNHYAAIPLVGISLATVEALARIKRVQVRKLLAVLVFVCACWTSYSWGASPFTDQYNKGVWNYGNDDRRQAKAEAVRMIPEGEPTSATYFFVPHLTHRQLIYTFPNPWALSNWGTSKSEPHDNRKVKWLVIDRNTLESNNKLIVACLLDNEFEIVYDRKNIFVAKRFSTPEESTCPIFGD